MNNRKNYLIAITCLICSQVSFAQTKDERKVAASVDSFKAALISSNISSLEKWTDDNLSYGHSGGLVEGKAQFVEKFRSGKSDFVSLDESGRTISVFGKTAVVRHTLNAVTNDNGTPGTVKIAVLMVWQKMGKQWKLIARQAVKPTS